MLSSRLKALVIPTIQTRDRSASSGGMPVMWTARHQEHDHRADHGLGDQLARRPEMQDVVQCAEHEHQHRRRRRGAGAGGARPSRGSGQTAGGNRVSAEHRNRLAAPAFATRRDEVAGAVRELPEQRSECDGEREAPDERRDGGRGSHGQRKTRTFRVIFGLEVHQPSAATQSARPAGGQARPSPRVSQAPPSVQERLTRSLY